MASNNRKGTVIQGWLLMLVVAVISKIISNLIVVGESHPVEAIVVAIIIGILLRNLKLVPKSCYTGISNFEKVLVWGIVLLGASLTLEILEVEPYALIVLAVTMFIGFFSIYLLAKKIGFGEKLGILLAVGTTICGGTAIAITSPLLESKEDETCYALGTIALWGLIALLIYPFIGRLLNFSQTVFGVWVSTAIHSTPQVVGAGYIYGDHAGKVATMVKLTRNIFMIPLAFIIGFWHLKRSITAKSIEDEGVTKWQVIAKGFPWFLFGYVFMAFLRGFGFFTPTGIHYFTTAGKFLILMGMAGIGLNTDFKKMIGIGAKPLLAGFIASVIVAIISIIMIWAVGIGFR